MEGANSLLSEEAVTSVTNLIMSKDFDTKSSVKSMGNCRIPDGTLVKEEENILLDW